MGLGNPDPDPPISMPNRSQLPGSTKERSPEIVSYSSRNWKDLWSCSKTIWSFYPPQRPNQSWAPKGPKSAKNVQSGDSKHPFCIMNNLGHLLRFPSPQDPHTRPHTSFSQPTLRCCQMPKTLLVTLIIWGDELRVIVHWKRSCHNHSSAILNWKRRCSPRGILAREKRVTFQQEMLILDLSATLVFLINPQIKMSHHLCSWGSRGERDPKLQLGTRLPEL